MFTFIFVFLVQFWSSGKELLWLGLSVGLSVYVSVGLSVHPSIHSKNQKIMNWPKLYKQKLSVLITRPQKHNFTFFGLKEDSVRPNLSSAGPKLAPIGANIKIKQIIVKWPELWFKLKRLDHQYTCLIVNQTNRKKVEYRIE